jgi:hypothetical protein
MEISEALLAQQQVVRLQALLEASRQLHSTIEIDESGADRAGDRGSRA